jgi:DNA-binding NarL/FixJ family response regulator
MPKAPRILMRTKVKPQMPALPAPKSSDPGLAARLVQVAIVEDDDWLRADLARVIGQSPDFKVLTAYRTAESALAGIPDARPDVVLMDINLPGMSGIECLRRLRAVCPEVQVLMLTVYEESEPIFNSLLAGASGYLLKRTSTAQIVESIRQVRAGGAPMTANIARRVVQYFNRMGDRTSECEKLSPREREVLERLAHGDAYKQIADKLGISFETVRMNVKHLYTKLHVHSRAEAVAKLMPRA